MTLYGRIGQIEAIPGKGEELARLLAEMKSMPGCLHYIVAIDAESPDHVWVTEIWENEGAHRASLGLPEVQETIGKGRPLISEFTVSSELVPVGGIGLAGVS